ncbi:MAG: hypothetical protein ABI384_02685 [Allobranchiibius sp.]|nr:hypothetical protein [Actinomycetota bacterium]
MESYSEYREAREALAEMERGEASPYVDYPRTPGWYPLTVGVWAGALVLAIALLQRSTWLGALAIVGLVVLEGAFLGWYQRLHGALPSLRNPPAEFRPLFQRYAFGFCTILGVAVALWFITNPWVTAIAITVLATGGIAAYERAYAAAAIRTRARLGRTA